MEDHQGEPWNFSITIIKSHKYPLRRQTHEEWLVEYYRGNQILNQKGEWGCNLPPKLEIDRETNKRKERDIPREKEFKNPHENQEPPPTKKLKRSKIPQNIRKELEEANTGEKYPKIGETKASKFTGDD